MTATVISILQMRKLEPRISNLSKRRSRAQNQVHRIPEFMLLVTQ